MSLVRCVPLALFPLVVLQAGPQAGQFRPWLDWLAGATLAGAIAVREVAKEVPQLACCFGVVVEQPD